MNWKKVAGMYLKYFLWIAFVIKFIVLLFFFKDSPYTGISLADFLAFITYLLIFSVILVPFVDFPIATIVSLWHFYKYSKVRWVKKILFSLFYGLIGCAIALVATTIFMALIMLIFIIFRLRISNPGGSL